MTEFVQEPHLLVQDDTLEFSPSWPDEIYQSGKYFRVVRAQPITYDKFWIIDADNSFDFRLDEDTGLLPTSKEDTIYQVLIGIKGDVLLYPLWPEGKYQNQLQKVGMRSYPSKIEKRYLGGYDATDSPFEDPHLVDFLVKNMNPLVYRLYNDSIVPEKVVLRFKVNKLQVEELGGRKEGMREVYHASDYKW